MKKSKFGISDEKPFFGINVEDMLSNMLSEEIARSIDKEIINSLRSMTSRTKDLKKKIEKYKNEYRRD